MNSYGFRAREHWQTFAPSRVATLDDPEAFFTELGQQVQAQVSELAGILAGGDDPRENYLRKVARLTTAHRIAEEVVMAQLVWIHDPALPLEQAREEWEQTRPADENLIIWAERMQDSPDLMPSTAELEDMAEQWALPVAFLEELVATEPPREYMRANEATLQEAATIRFLREVR